MPPRSGQRSVIPATRAGAVADELRRLILSGELAAGSHLRQLEIAERFGVSTTPVREAFTTLAREGLVRQDSHRGVIVFEPSIEDLQENFEIRMALESLAAELAAKSIDEEELDQLDALLDEMGDAIVNDPDRHTTELNPRFHSLIYAAARRPRLLALIDDLRRAVAVYSRMYVQPEQTRELVAAVQAEHEEIVAALRARAPKRAGKAIRTHIQHSLDAVLKAVKQAS